MDFEKKYWDKDKKCYIGVSDGKLYDYYNETEITDIKNDTYYKSLIFAGKNFDRNPSTKLELPYNRDKVTFAHNDFLDYSNLNGIINKLQANSDYIYQNSVIADGQLPIVVEPVKWADKNFYFPSKETEKFVLIQKESIGNDNIATEYTNACDEEDSYEYTIKNINGTWSTKSSFNTFLKSVDNENTNSKWITSNFIKDNRKISSLTESELEKIYTNIHPLPSNSYNLIVKNLDSKSISISPEEKCKNENEILIKFKTTEKEDKDYKETFSFKTNLVDKIINKFNPKFNTYYLRINSFSFLSNEQLYTKDNINNGKITKTGYKISQCAFYKGTDKNDRYFTVEDDASKSVNDTDSKSVYTFITSNEVKNGIYINTIHFKNRSFYDGKVTNFSLLYLDKEIIKSVGLSIKIEALGDKSIEDFRWNKSFCEIDLDLIPSTGAGSLFIRDFKYICDIKKSKTYHYLWTNGYSIFEAKSGITYGALKLTPAWLRGGSASRLITTPDSGNANEDDTIYLPSDDMLASDVYERISNPYIIYDMVPKIQVSETKYIGSDKAVINPYYKKRNYPLQEYFLENNIGNNLVKKYKSAEQIYSELFESSFYQSDTNKKGTYSTKSYPGEYLEIYEKMFDNIPEIKSKLSTNIIVNNSNIPYFNFFDINASDIVFVNDKFYIFIAFKDKILITKIEKDGKIDIAKTDNSIYIDKIKSDNTDYKFINIKSIRVKDNDLYVCDSKLNAVIQYDIESIFRTDLNYLSVDKVFVKNILQGDGKDKHKIYFNEPSSVAASDKKVYIVDKKNKCIKVYDRNLNYIKLLRNGKYALHNLQAVNVNPNAIILNNGLKIPKNSVWVISEIFSKLYVSIFSDDKIIFYGELTNIMLEKDRYTWEDEVKNIEFSFTNSSYYYIATTRNIYKFYTSNPLLPFGSYNYHSLSEENKKDTISNVINHRCFSICGKPTEEGDYIFNIFNVYKAEKLDDIISKDKQFNNLTYFEKYSCLNLDIDIGITEKNENDEEIPAGCPAFITFFYNEKDSKFITLSDLNIARINTYIYPDKNDYINHLTINKTLFALIHNLCNLKNSIIGNIETCPSNNIIIANNFHLDNYYQLLKLDNLENYYVHQNELLTVGLNRIFNYIYDIQYKIIQRMQTTHLSYTPDEYFLPKLI